MDAIVIMGSNAKVDAALIARRFPRARHAIVLGGTQMAPLKVMNEYGLLEIHHIALATPMKEKSPDAAIERSPGDADCPENTGEDYINLPHRIKNV